MVFIVVVFRPLSGDRLSEIAHRAHQLAHVTHFIIIPCHGLDQLFVAHADDLGLAASNRDLYVPMISELTTGSSLYPKVH